MGRQMIALDGSKTSSVETASSRSVRREHGIPIVMMYGENDWMDIAGGYAAEEKLKEEKERVLRDASREEREAEGGSAKVFVIKKAGHHLYLDGADEFNEVMREEMEDVRRREGGGKGVDGAV